MVLHDKSTIDMFKDIAIFSAVYLFIDFLLFYLFLKLILVKKNYKKKFLKILSLIVIAIILHFSVMIVAFNSSRDDIKLKDYRISNKNK